MWAMVPLWLSSATRLYVRLTYLYSSEYSPGTEVHVLYCYSLLYMTDVLPEKVYVKTKTKLFINTIIFYTFREEAYNESFLKRGKISLLKCPSLPHLIFCKWWFSYYVFIEWSPPTCNFVRTGIISYHKPIENISTLRHAWAHIHFFQKGLGKSEATRSLRVEPCYIMHCYIFLLYQI